MSSYDAPALTYELVRSRRRKKTLTLCVRRDGTLVMMAPAGTSMEEVERFFRAKEEWARKKIAARQGSGGAGEKMFLPGETFLFHGDPFPLEIVEADRGPSLALSHGSFQLRADRQAQGRRLFTEWYRRRAKEEFTERVGLYANRFGLKPASLTVTGARSRYGSCSATDKLSLTWRLVMAPYPVMDYVILHELAHIKVKNHSKEFWDFLSTLVPDYKQKRRWLKEKGHLLVL